MQNQQAYAHDFIQGKGAELEADGGLWSNESTRDTGINAGQTTVEAAIPVIGSNREIMRNLARWGGEELTTGNEVTHAFWRYFAGKSAKDMGKAISKDLFTKLNAQKLGINILASLVNNGIEWGSNEYENNLYANMLREIRTMRKDKGTQGINIQALQL